MIQIVDDIDKCAYYWKHFVENRISSVFDFWDLRMCFHETYEHKPSFLVLKEAAGIKGLLPLSYISDSKGYGFFPGEVWKNRTWLEKNPFYAENAVVLETMLDSLEAPFLLRYLERESIPSGFECFELDETGFLFFPAEYGFSFDEYLNVFPHKSLKKIQKEIETLKQQDVSFRYNDLKDVDNLTEMNISAYGESSYFSDERFLNGCEKVVAWLYDHQCLQITTVLVGGKTAAIDIGALWNNDYTVFAGGANRDFQGVAKLINFHHLERACKEKYRSVDFLCGDFNWKERFRLQPRPLFKISRNLVPQENLMDAVPVYA